MRFLPLLALSAAAVVAGAHRPPRQAAAEGVADALIGTWILVDVEPASSSPMSTEVTFEPDGTTRYVSYLFLRDPAIITWRYTVLSPRRLELHNPVLERPGDRYGSFGTLSDEEKRPQNVWFHFGEDTLVVSPESSPGVVASDESARLVRGRLTPFRMLGDDDRCETDVPVRDTIATLSPEDVPPARDISGADSSAEASRLTQRRNSLLAGLLEAFTAGDGTAALHQTLHSEEGEATERYLIVRQGEARILYTSSWPPGSRACSVVALRLAVVTADDRVEFVERPPPGSITVLVYRSRDTDSYFPSHEFW